MSTSVTVFWFRRDLRLNDNCGLSKALEAGRPLLLLFIFDKNILDRLENKADSRVEFIHERISAMNDELIKHGSGMITIFDTPEAAWSLLIKKYKIGQVFTNHDYEPYARQRDESIAKLLHKNKIEFHSYKDQVVFEKSDVIKDDNTPYTVYTPFKNKYLKHFKASDIEPHRINLKKSILFPIKENHILSLKDIGFQKGNFTFPDMKVDKNILINYSDTRDIPAVNGTSKLSLHIRFGSVSIRSLFKAAIDLKSDKWLNELIWREFYQMILWHFPYVAESAFKKNYNNIEWRNNEDEFLRWCDGNTGYPIVDAGMRELNATGFMHNRVRMITASFLVKHLLVDWKWGEAYFASKLLDFDLASNNGGWQWAAGSGCDAAPYFRIFNPYEQTRKFDPELKYIRKWVPEFEELTYPAPVVDHKFARERCLKVYKKALTEK